MAEYLSLKWGGPKAWKIETEETMAAAKVYEALGMSMSAMAQENSPEHKEALCGWIDAVQCETIYLDWDGKDVTKEEAKEYVRNYRT